MIVLAVIILAIVLMAMISKAGRVSPGGGGGADIGNGVGRGGVPMPIDSVFADDGDLPLASVDDYGNPAGNDDGDRGIEPGGGDFGGGGSSGSWDDDGGDDSSDDGGDGGDGGDGSSD